MKTLWEKEKMLVTSIFSHSHNVFYHSQSKFQFLSHIYFVVCKSFQFGMVFPTMFSTIHKKNLNFSVTFIFSSANPFNLDWFNILLFSKELITLSQQQLTHHLSLTQQNKLMSWREVRYISISNHPCCRASFYSNVVWCISLHGS